MLLLKKLKISQLVDYSNSGRRRIADVQ